MKALAESLERVDRHIIRVVKRLEEQRNRVLELRRRGEDDRSSQRLLASLIHLLTIYEKRREHLVERLLLSKVESEAGVVGEDFSPSLNL